MIEQITDIVRDFEADLLNGVHGGADEAGLTKIRDMADDRLRDLKKGASVNQLAEIFTAALEIGTKLDLALQVIRK